MKKILKLILLALNVAALVLMLGSTMAGVTTPSRFLAFSFLGYGYLYFLIANVAFVFIWLFMSSRWFLLPLAGIVARCVFLPLYFQVGGTEAMPNGPERPQDAVRLLTFNVHHFQGVEFRRELADSNMLLFLDMVDSVQPDVLTLQEYVGHGDTVPLTERLRERGYIYQASGYSSGSMTGEVIFSKLPMLGAAHVKEPTIQYADLLWMDDTLRVFCIHLSSYGLDASDHQQLHDIKHGNVDNTTGRGTYHKFRETILEHEEEWQRLEPLWRARRHRTLVAGDFNDPPASYFYQQCRKLLNDSYREAGQGFSTTYHGTFTRRRNAIFPAFRIDMVLHSPDMRAVAYRRIKSEISDHYPVVAEIRMCDTQ